MRCESTIKTSDFREDGGEEKKKITSKGSVCIAKNCDIVLEKAAISRPRSQFFPIRTSQLANNIFILTIGCILLRVFKLQQMVYFKYLILMLWIHLAWPQGTFALLEVFSSVEI